MKEVLDIISQRKIAVFIVTILSLAITFETFQQLYYIKRFNLSDDATFFGILKNQSLRWLVWMLLSGVIVFFVKRNASQKPLTPFLISRYIALLVALVLLNIFIISVIQSIMYVESFDLKLFFLEYIPFYTFQKAPIYTLGYIAILTISHLYVVNQQLQIEVQKVSDLKKTNIELYNKLNTKISDKAKILNIKIGNKRKIIPVEEILWIESDDYCVKVHTIDKKTYSMRSTLKSLEEKLENNFMRVHRKAIVNMNSAKELDFSDNPSLILSDNTEVPISKSNLKLVRDFLT